MLQHHYRSAGGGHLGPVRTSFYKKLWTPMNLARTELKLGLIPYRREI